MKINEKITSVGKIDWELKKFHGEELSTLHGSSYNSYLIQDKKNVLIDTVWYPFAGEFLENLKKHIDIEKIDYIIVNHAEPDHSGALPYLMSLIPETPIYCSANGVKSIKGYYHKDWNFKTVKTGDRVNIGDSDLVFIEAPMLHWPDTMMTYMTNDNVLFSSDIFGQHYASEFMYDGKVPQDELIYEAMKYYTNIINPFSKKVTAKLNEVLAMNLQLDMLCPAHGVIWKDNPLKIISLYQDWANSYQENQISIIYDTMYNSTRRMAESIANGIKQKDSEVVIKIFRSSNTDKNDLMTEIFKSKAIIVGSPTVNGGMLSSIASVLDECKGLSFTNKKASCFGSFGWSPASVKVMSEKLTEAGFEFIGEGVKSQWRPDEISLEKCVEFGNSFVEAIK